MENQISSTEEVNKTAPESNVNPYFASENEEVSVTPENDSEVVQESTVKNDDSDDENHNNEDAGDSEKKSGRGFEKRIERFNRRLAERDAEIEHWKNIALNNQPVHQTQEVKSPELVSTPKPQINQFHSQEDYIEALADWKFKEREIASKVQEVQKSYQQKLNDIKSSDPEYDDNVADFNRKYANVNAPELNQYLLESEKGPELYYHLVQNNEDLDNILRLPPLHRVAALGRLESKLGGSKESKPAPKVSRAPQPIVSEKGSSPTIKSLTDPNLSQKDYRELRMQNKRKF